MVQTTHGKAWMKGRKVDIKKNLSLKGSLVG